MHGGATAEPPARDIVLWGIGHTHAHVVRRWIRTPIPGARLTCVSETPRAAYSGLLPAVLNGEVPRERMEIDLVQLCGAAGARLVLGEGTGLDLARRALIVSGTAPIRFDLLSVGIGSVPAAPDGAPTDTMVIPIKPMWSLIDRLRARLTELPAGRAPRVLVVGGGAGGVEVALCLPPFVRSNVRGLSPHVTLVQADVRLLPGSCARAARLARRALEHAGVRVLPGRRVVNAGAGRAVLDDAAELEADVVLWATGAVGPPALSRLGLPNDERGFLLTRRTLQSLGDGAVLAVGDSGTIDEARAPKAGVHAVRQGPVLWKNLKRWSKGLPMTEHTPQRRFLRLLNTGDGEAIAEYGPFALKGRPFRYLKDWIDHAFVARYRNAR